MGWEKNLRIGVVIHMNVRGCTDIFTGILQYALTKPNWQLHRFRPHWESTQNTPPLPDNMDGYVGHIDNKRNFSELAAMRLPVVSTSDALERRMKWPPHFQSITLDRAAIGRQAAEVALATGPHTVLVVDTGRTDPRIHEPLMKVLRESHVTVQHHEDNSTTGEPTTAVDVAIRDAAPGTAILVLDEETAEHVLELCRMHNRRVPTELTLVSASPDGLVCDTCRPSITYVRFPFRQIGYEAAQLLDETLHGRVRTPVRRRIPQPKPAWRESTAIRLTGDAAVDAVLRAINRCEGRTISVNDVIADAPLQRRALERRFTQSVGRSIREEIERAHLRRARELLETTDLPVVDVAARSGFSTPSRLCAVFRKAEHETPAEYRARQQQGRGRGSAGGR